MNRIYKNVVGLEIRRLRRLLGWSQFELARHLRLAGLSTNRARVAKVECGRLHVCDFELLYFARVLGTNVQYFFPDVPAAEPLDDALATLFVIPQKPVKEDLQRLPRGRPRARKRNSVPDPASSESQTIVISQQATYIHLPGSAATRPQ